MICMFCVAKIERYLSLINVFLMKKMIKLKEITIEKDIFLDFPKPQSFVIEQIFF